MDLGPITIVGEPLSIWSIWVAGFDESDPRTEEELDQEKIDFIDYLDQSDDLSHNDTNGDLEINFKTNWPNLKQLIDKLHQIIDYLRDHNLPYSLSATVFIKFDNIYIKGLLTINGDTNLIDLVYRGEDQAELIQEQYPLIDRKNKFSYT
jgi:hypothetical protein